MRNMEDVCIQIGASPTATSTFPVYDVGGEGGF